jgi:hypothetical protein
MKCVFEYDRHEKQEVTNRYLERESDGMYDCVNARYTMSAVGTYAYPKKATWDESSLNFFER